MANDISSPTIPVTQHPTRHTIPPAPPYRHHRPQPRPGNPSGYDNDIPSPHFLTPPPQTIPQNLPVPPPRRPQPRPRQPIRVWLTIYHRPPFPSPNTQPAIPSPQSHPTITTDRNPAPGNPSGYHNDISSPFPSSNTHHPRKLSPKTYPCRRRPPAKPPPATHPGMVTIYHRPPSPLPNTQSAIPSPQTHPTITTDRNPAPGNPSCYDNDIPSPISLTQHPPPPQTIPQNLPVPPPAARKTAPGNPSGYG